MIFFHVFLHNLKNQYLLCLNMFLEYRYLYCVIWDNLIVSPEPGISCRNVINDYQGFFSCTNPAGIKRRAGPGQGRLAKSGKEPGNGFIIVFNSAPKGQKQ